MASEKFEFFTRKNKCIQVKQNYVTAVNVDVKTVTPNFIRDKAVRKHPDCFPTLTPDNASTVLIFHTETGDYTLAAIRKNPDVDPSYHHQINGSRGGYLSPDRCSDTFVDALLSTLSQKMLLDNALLIEKLTSEENEAGLKALNRLSQLRDAIALSTGWGPTVAVHVNERWEMCVLTAVKHIQCHNADLEQIQKDLALLMPIEKQRILDTTPEGTRPNLRTISNFQILELAPIISNAKESYLLDENDKAEKAQRNYPNQPSVTFNDLTMERLAAHNGFDLPAKNYSKLVIEDKTHTQTLLC